MSLTLDSSWVIIWQKGFHALEMDKMQPSSLVDRGYQNFITNLLFYIITFTNIIIIINDVDLFLILQGISPFVRYFQHIATNRRTCSLLERNSLDFVLDQLRYEIYYYVKYCILRKQCGTYVGKQTL